MFKNLLANFTDLKIKFLLKIVFKNICKSLASKFSQQQVQLFMYNLFKIDMN